MWAPLQGTFTPWQLPRRGPGRIPPVSQFGIIFVLTEHCMNCLIAIIIRPCTLTDEEHSFRDVLPWRLVARYWSVRGKSCLNPTGKILHHEDGSNKFFQNIITRPIFHTTSHPRRQSSKNLPSRDAEIVKVIKILQEVWASKLAPERRLSWFLQLRWLWSV